MHLTVERGRIRVHFPKDIDNKDVVMLQQPIFESIGSATNVNGNPRLLSVALGWQNLRKLRQLGARLSDDPHTRDVVTSLRAKLDEHERESAQAQIAKEGGDPDGIPADYEFLMPPFEHQKKGWRFLHAMKNAALFGDCGVGKTFMVLTFGDSLIKQHGDWVFLVICPVNLIKHVWIEDAAKFAPDLSVVSLREDTVTAVRASDYDEKSDPKELDRKMRAALRANRKSDPEWQRKAKRRAQARHRKKLDERFAQDADMYVINPENVRTDAKEKRVMALARRLVKAGKRLCLVVDESTMLKNRSSRIYKATKRITAHTERSILMSGTPSPNGILDLWAQFNILDQGLTLQPAYNDFRQDFAHEIPLRGQTWKDKRGKEHAVTIWRPKAGKVAELHSIIEPRSIRFRTEDCIDLPPIRFIRRDVEMTGEQRTFYDAMQERLYAEIEGESVTARVAVAKLMKLREVTGGFVVTDDEKHKPFNKDAPKMLELDQLLAQSIDERIGDEGPPRKAIIWAQYQWECKTLVARYAKKYRARGLFGGISSSKKDHAIEQFRKDPKSQILVCHPASAGHGLTLTEANYAFYYSLNENYELFYQSFRRISRPGQKRAMTFYFLVAPDTIDENLLNVIREKKNMADAVTDGRFSRESFLELRKKSETGSSSWQPDLFPGD